MIVDISIFENWNKLQKIKNYSDLKKNFYLVAINDPLPEDVLLEQFKDEGYVIKAPISICFLLNYYKAKDANNDEIKTFFYNNALKVSNKKEFKTLRNKFKEKIDECKKYYIRYYKPSYEVLYGKEKAKIIRCKISSSMKNLDKEVIEKRNKAIKKYAEHRPQSHNEAIKRSKQWQKEKLQNQNQEKRDNQE